MRFVFADAGYWIAVLDTDDVLHQRALDVSEDLGAIRIITTDMVLAEVASHFAAYGPSYRRAVTLLIEDITQAEDAEVVPQTHAQFDTALAYYARYADKEWSLVDCASFLAMAERGIYEALAYDHHFQQAGIRPLLRGR